MVSWKKNGWERGLLVATRLISFTGSSLAFSNQILILIDPTPQPHSRNPESVSLPASPDASSLSFVLLGGSERCSEPGFLTPVSVCVREWAQREGRTVSGTAGRSSAQHPASWRLADHIFPSQPPSFKLPGVWLEILRAWGQVGEFFWAQAI